MIEYYYLLILILPLFGCLKYKKYVQTAIKTLFVMYWCKPTSSFVKKIDNNIYKVDFKINNKRYSFLMKLNNGPNHIEKITDGESDITKTVEPYFNFKDADIITNLTPHTLGYNSICVESFAAGNQTFEDDDNILHDVI